MLIAVRLSACLVIALGACGCASFDDWQRRAIFQPSRAAVGTAAPGATETFDLSLPNGHTVHAWYLPADGAGIDDASTVLFLHGSRHSLDDTAWRVRHLQSLGFSVLAIDYRGFGRSTTMLPSDASTKEDARAALEELKRRETNPARRFVYGFSLGGALAIELAAHEEGIAGVVLESTFTRIRDLVRTTRWRWLPFARLLVTQDFNSLARIARVSTPILLLHGTADEVVPHQMADRLLAAAVGVPTENRRILKVEGATHGDVIGVGGERYDRAVREFTATARSAATVTLAAEAEVVP